MTDAKELVRLLRYYANQMKPSGLGGPGMMLSQHKAHLLDEAADEIERRAPANIGDMRAPTEELAAAWRKLEDFGYPPETMGINPYGSYEDFAGHLPAAIEAALDCLIRQREGLIKEVTALRSLTNSHAGGE